jgi:hypothetical protein
MGAGEFMRRFMQDIVYVPWLAAVDAWQIHRETFLVKGDVRTPVVCEASQTGEQCKGSVRDKEGG